MVIKNSGSILTTELFDGDYAKGLIAAIKETRCNDVDNYIAHATKIVNDYEIRNKGRAVPIREEEFEKWDGTIK